MARGHSEGFRHMMATTASKKASAPAHARGDTVLIYENELSMMARFVSDYPNIETGGDLFGFWTHSGSPVIEYVLGAGRTAEHQTAAFYQEASFLKAAGAALRDLHGLQHIGTWHSHHRIGLTKPSGGDSNTMQRALDNNHFNAWLLTICNFADNSDRVEMRGYLYHAGGGGEHQQLTWLVLPGSSPVRTAMESVKDFPRADPRTVTAEYQPIPSTTFAEMTSPSIPKSPDFPSFSFMATPEGKAEFYRLFADLSNIERNVEILQREDGRVSLSFQRDGYVFAIVFPHSYPVVKPSVECSPVKIPKGQEEAWRNPRTLYLAMDRGDNVITRIEELVTTFFMNREHTEPQTPGQIGG